MMNPSAQYKCHNKFVNSLSKDKPSEFSKTMSGNIKRKSTSTVKEDLQITEFYLPVDRVKQAELLLPYKSHAKRQNKEIFLKQLDLKVSERYKLRNTQMKKELQKMGSSLDQVSAVTDIDEEFFTVANGRPLYHSIPLYKSLKIILSSHLRIRHEVGYKKDTILNIETNFRLEKSVYDSSLRRLTEQAKIFDQFIMEDYQKSMTILETGEKLNDKLDAKLSELQNLADESYNVMSRLISLDYKYGLQQKYGRFLYYLSPPTWRSSNREFARSVEIEAKGFDFGNSNEEDTFTVIFEKMRRECLSSLTAPVLYFSRPNDLVDVFTGIEEQQLYHFSRGMQLVPQFTFLKEGIRILKEKNALDSAAVTASITRLKSLLSFCEERSAQLKEQFFKVLYGSFYKSVGTPEVLKLILHLEFCYDKLFFEKPMNVDMLTMAKAIEDMYLDYTSRLDSIESDTVRRALKKCMDINKRKLVRAKNAAKELRLFNRLENELLRAHNLCSQEEHKQSSNINEQKVACNRLSSRIYIEKDQSLTDAEIEYLTLFTDWIKNEDPALYLQSYSQHDKTSQ